MGFSAYLQSTIANYEKQRDRYTLTDLQVEYPAKEARSPDGSERQPEKQVERLEVLAGLREYVQKGQVLLVGKPGSGKSTALERLRWELAQAALTDARQPIPVLVALRSDRSIVEMIEMELLKGDPDLELEEKEIKRLLRRQQFFLLLDGLNEIPSQPREHEMRQFREDYPRTPMIFTSRELGTGLGIEQKLAMCRLTERQIRSFVENYLPDYAEMLLRQLKDRLRELAETPLLLKLLCDVFDPVTQQIPQSKGDLFRAVDAKYNDWKQREGVRTAEKFWQWNGEILRYLAFVMLHADGTPTGKWLQIERSYAEHLLEEFLQDRVTAPGEKAKDWLQDLLEHHLLQLTANTNQIEFHHQLFQEYYAAEYLMQQLPYLSEAKLKRDYLNLLKWTESLEVMLSLTHQKNTTRIIRLALEVSLLLTSRLIKSAKVDSSLEIIQLIEQSHLLVTTQHWLFGEAGIELKIPKLFRLALQNEDENLRNSAAVTLTKFPNEVRPPELNEFLQKEGFIKVINFSNNDTHVLTCKEIINIWKRREEEMTALERLFDKQVGSYQFCMKLHESRSLKLLSDKTFGFSSMQLHNKLVSLVSDLIFDLWNICQPFTIVLLLSKLFELWGNSLSQDDFITASKVIDDIKANQNVAETRLLCFLKSCSKREQDALAATVRIIERCREEDVDFSSIFLILSISVRDDISNILKEQDKPLIEVTSIAFSERLIALINPRLVRDVFELVIALQDSYQFYNYEIFQLPLEPAPPTVIDLQSKIDAIDQRTKQMAEQPSISIGTISGGIQNFTPNRGTQTNTNIGTQNNYFGADDDLKQQITDLNQFIAELEMKYPQVQTEADANKIIDAEIVAVQTTNINCWQTLCQQMLLLKRQFLNPERQLQALKAGLGEAAKHYLEDSVWAKAILTYIDKLSETPDQGA